MIHIKGLQKISLNNFVDKPCCVVFLGGCNFRCPYCFNPELVFNKKEDEITEDKFFSFLDSRKGLLDGVCITGGEPTLSKGLVEFISKIKEKGFLVKLDTNGSNSSVVKELISNKLVDYIAMDIKGPLERYSEICGVKVDVEEIKKSVLLLQKFGNFEFRTTVLPDLLGEKDFLEIGEWLKGSKRYYLQQFKIDEHIDNSFKNKKSYSDDELYKFRDLLKDFFDCVEVRGT